MALASAKRGQAEGPTSPARQRRSVGAAPRFLVAAGISSYGDWLTTVALVVLLYRLTGTATAPALYIVARVAPRLLGPAPGGALADRFGPARVAALCALGQAALTAAIVGLANVRIIAGIYFAVAGAQFLGSMAQPAYSAIIPHIVRRSRLARINAAYNAILESCLLVSPALGALLLIAGASPQSLILADAASFLVAALLLLTLRTPGHGTAPHRKHGGMLAGVSIVRGNALLRIFAVGHLTNALAITALQAVLVVAASQRFGHDTDVGWLYAAVGAGGVAGSVALLRRSPTVVRSAGISLAVFGELIPLGLFAFVPNLALACALLFVSSVFAALYQTSGAIGLQRSVPQELLGRVNAVVRFALYVGMLLGAVVAATTLTLLSWDRMLLIVTAAAAALLVIALVTQPRAAVEPVEVELAGRARQAQAALSKR